MPPDPTRNKRRKELFKKKKKRNNKGGEDGTLRWIDRRRVVLVREWVVARLGHA